MDMQPIAARELADAIPKGTKTVLVIGVQTWGKGENLEAAKRQFRTEGGKLTDGYVVTCYPEEAHDVWVDGMGRTNTMWDEKIPFEKRVPLAILGVRGSKTSF